MNLMESHEPIAIVGMSCRYPKANNLSEFWNLLRAGKTSTGSVPAGRWKAEDYPTKFSNSCLSMNAGFLSVPVDKFDASFFGISPKEATVMDPQGRLLLQVVWEALEDAFINPESLQGSNTGVFLGSWLNDYKDILLQSPAYGDFYRRYMGNSIGSTAARISFLFGLTGPSIATESGCSSSMVAVHLACKSLLRGECKLALACGVNLLLKPFDKDEMPVMLSSEGKCKAFDASADGFARAEGVGVLILKKLSDATEQQDKIWGLIRGSALTQEGLSKSMGTPTVYTESLAMQLALKDAGVNPAQVSYVEAHGTGTKIGDPMEIEAIAKAYGCCARVQPLIIGSVKSNIGHTESCSGIAGIMKVLLAMQHNIIPAHINLTNLNPEIHLDKIPARIPTDTTEWKRNTEYKRVAGVNSFGITGTDAHVILEEPPEEIMLSRVDLMQERPVCILKFSAKTEEALCQMLVNFKVYCEVCTDLWPDITFTANTTRPDFTCRAAIVAESKQQATSCIESGHVIRNTKDVGDKSICFLFPGQGSQYPGMGKLLYDTSLVFKESFDHCADYLKRNYNIDIKKEIWNLSPEHMNQILFSQTGIFCVEYALFKMWASWGIKPDFVLGHSLGEFAALVACEALSVENALTLVTERCLLIETLSESKMLAVQSDKDTVERHLNILGISLDFAAFNSSSQTVVAGSSENILKFEAFLRQDHNLKSVVLPSTHAFHSRCMDPVLKQYEKVVDSVIGRCNNINWNCGYISGVTGDSLHSTQLNSEYFVKHTRHPVLYKQACQTAFEKYKCTTFVEIGPSSVLSSLTLKTCSMQSPKYILCLPSMQKGQNDWSTVLKSLANLYANGVNINWQTMDSKTPRKKVKIPGYPFQGQRYWPTMQKIKKQVRSSSHGSIPFLGNEIFIASPLIIFENELTLDSNVGLEFVNDHKIGKNIIFPGAMYLEMCAAAFATRNELISGLTINDLIISAPLALNAKQEKSNITIQTILEPQLTPTRDIIQYGIKFASTYNIDEARKSSAVKWTVHASAKIGSLHSEAKLGQHELQKLRENSTIHNPTHFYQWALTTGLNFGPSFRSIEIYWSIINRSNQSRGTLAQLAPVVGNYTIAHPTILDGMLQAMILHSKFIEGKKLDTRLYVPVKIGLFICNTNFCTSQECGNVMYALISASDENKLTAKLLDNKGYVHAIMSSVEFVETTVKTIEAVLESQLASSTMPGLWEMFWKKENLSPLQYRLDLKQVQSFYKSVDMQGLTLKPHTFENIRNIDNELLELVYACVVIALQELGWNPELNKEYAIEQLHEALNINEKYINYFGFIIEMLVERGLIKIKNNLVRLNVRFPNWNNFDLILEMFKKMESSFKSTTFISNVGRNLSKILTGNMPPHGIFFPVDASSTGVAEFYNDYIQTFGFAAVLSKLNQKRFDYIRRNTKEPKHVLRILEVGAGTGSYTNILLQTLTTLDVNFEYTYTDVSPSFFPNAKNFFGHFEGNMIYKSLDIEQDPLSQGFLPEYYDLCLAFEVVHATKNISKTLKNIRMLLRNGGMLDLGETTRLDAHYLTFLFGLMPGYWKFEDTNLRPKRPVLLAEKWVEVLEDNGFKVNCVLPSYLNTSSLICCETKNVVIEQASFLDSTSMKTWIVFPDTNTNITDKVLCKLSAIGRKAVLVSQTARFHETENSYSEDFLPINYNEDGDFKKLFQHIICKIEVEEIEGILFAFSLQENSNAIEPFFYLTKNLHHLTESGKACLPLRIIVLTQGCANFESFGLPLSYTQSTVWGYAKSLMNEVGDKLDCRCVDIEGTATDMMLEQIFFEFFYQIRKEPQVAYNGIFKHTLKLKPLADKSDNTEDLELPTKSKRFQLLLPSSKSIADLKFVELTKQTLGSNKVEIRVKCVALNFRDVLVVIKPTPIFESISTVGLDIVGQIVEMGDLVTEWKVGDFVLTLNMNNNGAALPSHIQVDQNLLIRVPENLTLHEAVTLPAVFATAHKCLIYEAQLKHDDTVLIHTASGGVGIAAINICRQFIPTEKIFVTAGTPRKRNYLREIGLKHVYSSRDINYSKQILDVTNGKGVSIVLNSLTGSGFKEATIACCGYGARFIEMSKLNIWSNNDVQKLRSDVYYSIVDVSQMDYEGTKQILATLKHYLEQKSVKPLPYVKFDATKIRQALQYFQKSQHIGKVVIVMPEALDRKTPLFHDRATYLVTGGLGGIGFEVGKWMITQNAKYVLLAGRNAPSTELSNEIQQINSQRNANLIAVQLDVSNLDECNKLVYENLKKMGLPPLKGIMHAAGTLADGVILNQDWVRFSSVFKAKIDGTINLHKVTKEINLEHFVTFSSFAAALGPPGQSNHAAANQFMDSFCQYRHSIGLPAITINWGNWGEVGVAKSIDFLGIKPITVKQGLAALEFALRNKRLQTLVANLEDLDLMQSKQFPQLFSYLDETVVQGKQPQQSKETQFLNSESFFKEYRNKRNAVDRVAFVKVQVKQIIGKVLNLPLKGGEMIIDDQSSFESLGMDSLMFLESKNNLQSLFGNEVGKEITEAVLKEHNTVMRLTEFILCLIEKY